MFPLSPLSLRTLDVARTVLYPSLRLFQPVLFRRFRLFQTLLSLRLLMLLLLSRILGCINFSPVLGVNLLLLSLIQ